MSVNSSLQAFRSSLPALFLHRFLICLIPSFIALPAKSNEITAISAADRGWYRIDGQHIVSNKNTFTGDGGGPESESIFRSFFLFDVPKFPGEVVAAQINLQLYGVLLSGYGAVPNSILFPFTVYDVETSATDLATVRPRGSVAGQSIYQDIGSGSFYGQYAAHSIEVGTILSINLNQQAIHDINNLSNGTFAIGIALDPSNWNTTLAGGNYGGILFSDVYNEPLTHQLIVTTVPEPDTYVLLVSGLGLMGLIATRRRRQSAVKSGSCFPM